MTSSVYPISSLLSILVVVRLRNGPTVSSWIAFQANPIMVKAHLTRKSALYSCPPSEPVRTHFSTYSLVYCTLNFLLHLTFTSPFLRRQVFFVSFSLLDRGIFMYLAWLFKDFLVSSVTLRFFRDFSSVVRQMPGYNSERRGTDRTLPH